MHIPCDGRTVDAGLDDGTTIQSMGPPSFGLSPNGRLELELSLDLPTFDAWFAKISPDRTLNQHLAMMTLEDRAQGLAGLITAYTRDIINLAVIPLYRR